MAPAHSNKWMLLHSVWISYTGFMQSCSTRSSKGLLMCMCNSQNCNSGHPLHRLYQPGIFYNVHGHTIKHLLSWQCIYSNYVHVPSGLVCMCTCIESAITMVTTTLYKQLYHSRVITLVTEIKRKQSLILVCLTSLRGLHFNVVVRNSSYTIMMGAIL